jgi:hypothetical protein
MSAKNTTQRFEAEVEHTLKEQGLKPDQFRISSTSKPGGKIVVTVSLNKGVGSTDISKALDSLATRRGFELLRPNK